MPQSSLSFQAGFKNSKMERACPACRAVFHLCASGKEWLGRALAFGGNVNQDYESWPFHAALVCIKCVRGETPRKGRDAMKSVTWRDAMSFTPAGRDAMKIITSAGRDAMRIVILAERDAMSSVQGEIK